jgi:hypothetical protein
LYITAALEALQKGAKRKERDVDRIRWALDSVAKYAGRTAYRQEVTSELRTGTSDKALQYMDCTEFAARFLQLACGLEKVPWFTTSTLTSIAATKGIYEGYLQFIIGSNEEPFTDIKPGDIFLWRIDIENNGHVGIVESYNEPYVYILESLTNSFESSLNTGTCSKCVRKSKYTRTGKALSGHEEWKGYFRPIITNK